LHQDELLSFILLFFEPRHVIQLFLQLYCGRSAGATRLVLLNQIIAGPAKDILNLVYGYASMGYKKLPLATLACGDAGWKY
jgi:hypothetical protein